MTTISKRPRSGAPHMPRLALLKRNKRPLADIPYPGDDGPPAPPSWSPLTRLLGLTGPLSLLFDVSFFTDIDIWRPTLTQVRRLNREIARQRRLGLLPDWFPEDDATPETFVHLFARAIVEGPSAVIDLMDIFALEPKAAERLQCGFARQYFDFDPGAFRDGQSTLAPSVSCTLCAAIVALEPLGIVPLRGSGSFFLAYQDGFNDPAIRQMALWYALEDNDEILRLEAFRVIDAYKRGEDDDTGAFAAAHRFLDPAWKPPAPEASTAAPPPDPAPAPDAPREPAPPLAVPAAPQAFASWRAEPMPEGVEMSQRALRELRKEAVFAAERLNDAIEALAAYRQMRLGVIAPEDYAEACRSRRFADSQCFASDGSFSAFRQHYEVRHENRTLRLERHLKWGKANNARSALRVYYAWDAEREVVVIGSAPRHLPIWRS